MSIMFLVVGLMGAIPMFCGDMLLYYDKKDYVSDGSFTSVIEMMRNVSQARLYIGGIIGPIAAFLYCIGYYHVVSMIDSDWKWLRYICWGICSLAIIVGGTYHSHCSYLGIIGKLKDENSMNQIIQYFTFINKVSMLFQIVGLLMLAIMIGCGLLAIPRWMCLLTPGVLYLLLPLVRKLPKGIHIIICGGWSNLIFVIYYLALLCVTV